MLIEISAPVYDLPVEHIASYLQFQGWELAHQNRRWLVFHGRKSTSGDPFEIVLPRDIDESDYRFYVGQAIKILSSLNRQTPATTANDILRYDLNKYDRDIFNIRILDNADMSSIPLRLAHKAIAGLQELFASATISEEKKPRPYFPRVRSNPSKILDMIRFGHTFSGSFGYSVESPVKIQNPGQQDMFPLQRRVLERIVRGLVNADKAAKDQKVEPLLDGFEFGFSANMCDAILGISDDHNKVAIEYSIEWSNEIVVAEDLRTFKGVYIQQDHLEFLAQASEIMRQVQPELVTIEGHIVNLRSPDDPQSEADVDRKVTVEWNKDDGTTRKVVVKLDKEQYNEALTAHKYNRLLSVTGLIEDTERELCMPRDFKIIG
ncbi:MAG: hypothetical protein OXI34_13605 [Chloroflexota bacterium]|nr:hypothetical protein [Chloroflexota bacterium]MDE2948005.1 hypothetical protein [Chloroflexota bacterium]